MTIQGVGPGGKGPTGYVYGSVVDGSTFQVKDGGAYQTAWYSLAQNIADSANNPTQISDGEVIYVLTRTGLFGQGNNPSRAGIDGLAIEGGDQMSFPGDLNLNGGGPVPRQLLTIGQPVTQGGGIYVDGHARRLQIKNNAFQLGRRRLRRRDPARLALPRAGRQRVERQREHPHRQQPDHRQRRHQPRRRRRRSSTAPTTTRSPATRSAATSRPSTAAASRTSAARAAVASTTTASTSTPAYDEGGGDLDRRADAGAEELPEPAGGGRLGRTVPARSRSTPTSSSRTSRTMTAAASAS